MIQLTVSEVPYCRSLHRFCTEVSCITATAQFRLLQSWMGGHISGYSKASCTVVSQLPIYFTTFNTRELTRVLISIVVSLLPSLFTGFPASTVSIVVSHLLPSLFPHLACKAHQACRSQYSFYCGKPHTLTLH
jgi:hypothetical protein